MPIRWEGRGLGFDLYMLGAAALACAAHTLSESVGSFVSSEGVWGRGYGCARWCFLRVMLWILVLMRMWVDVPPHSLTAMCDVRGAGRRRPGSQATLRIVS